MRLSLREQRVLPVLKNQWKALYLCSPISIPPPTVSLISHHLEQTRRIFSSVSGLGWILKKNPLCSAIVVRLLSYSKHRHPTADISQPPHLYPGGSLPEMMPGRPRNHGIFEIRFLSGVLYASSSFSHIVLYGVRANGIRANRLGAPSTWSGAALEG
ncbi:hypothetical protein BDV97DRAFT_364669 [Delphinella strobiligena]|nr:hypothetical protein BDV97DRAFT_364669 [Delphinella strobiligena]